jgi:transcriptional regulator with XRE-family HTH domain
MMKMHRPTISEIEAGRRRVSAEELKEFAQRYHTSVGWLTGEEPEIADPSDQRIRLAARELSKLSKDDLQRVLRFLATMIAADSDDSSAR